MVNNAIFQRFLAFLENLREMEFCPTDRDGSQEERRNKETMRLHRQHRVIFHMGSKVSQFKKT